MSADLRQQLVPSLSIPTQRSRASTAMSSQYTADSARMDELSKVKQELEEALRQVKDEMREGGATKSQWGRSTTRTESVMSDLSSVCSSSMGDKTENWDLTGNIASKRNRKLATQRGRVRMNLHDKNSKPLVQRPTKASNREYLPAPSPSAFRHQTHITSNQSEYVPLKPIAASQNQGPTKSAVRKKEGHRMFSKSCEDQVNTSAITGSKVFAARIASR